MALVVKVTIKRFAHKIKTLLKQRRLLYLTVDIQWLVVKLFNPLLVGALEQWLLFSFKVSVVTILLKYANYVCIHSFIIKKLAICFIFCVHALLLTS